MLTQETITNALKSVKYPGFSRDIISFGLLKNVAVNGGAVSVALQLTSPNPAAAQQIKQECEAVLKGLAGVSAVHVEVKSPAGTAGAPGPAAGSAHDPWSNQARVPGINRIIAVASGKGGVG